MAQALNKEDVYTWLVTKGYFPEAYVLPPCFEVTKYPGSDRLKVIILILTVFLVAQDSSDDRFLRFLFSFLEYQLGFGRIYFEVKKTKKGKTSFNPDISIFQEVHFPKTNLTDRTFGIIDPKIHSDIARRISNHWYCVTSNIFHEENQVYSYSFPIPLDKNQPGDISHLRSGRMIYEWIEMAENDVASIAFQYKFLIKTDIKNFYPSIYTHSIPWSLHGKSFIRDKVNGKDNRNNYDLLGNCLDKLFQSANDGCTNGIPIGPVVSDLVAEIVLSGVDRKLSQLLKDDKNDRNVTIVRFKDDYRILAKSESIGRTTIKMRLFRFCYAKKY
ncbi:hypothetical protein CKA32_001938 [Geitlerinema sp. FC II]|nr:hypothetical protein CKA32_001938 [Geitlerinema sp. FC II]